MRKFNEVIVISGKGGTGKTSLTASIIPYVEDIIIADCDVDAPDLNILFGNRVQQKTPFVGTKKAKIDKSMCTSCGACVQACRFHAISEDFTVNNMKCEGCDVCKIVCPIGAIYTQDAVVGDILHSETAYGLMIHGKLIPGEETSGKLVSEVRKKAKEHAEKEGIKNIIVDGSPGIACNVISSITGAAKVIIVVEPTTSGLHDLRRVYEVTQKFRTETSVVINKWNLSPDVSVAIEVFCAENGIPVDLKIPFDTSMVEAISKKEIPSVYNKLFFKSIGFKDAVNKWFPS